MAPGLAKGLQALPTFHILNYPLRNGSVNALAELFRYNNGLRAIDVSQSRIDDDGVIRRILFVVLKVIPSLYTMYA